MTERNITLDYFKVALCVMVVTIHLQPLFNSDNIFGWLISNGIARIAVPSFFLMNGYYLANKMDSFNTVLKYLKRIGLIFVVWSLIYLYIYSEDTPVQAILLSVFMGNYHLWYLAALIVGVLIIYLLRRITKNDIVLAIVALVLFGIGYYIQTYLFWININGHFIPFSDEVRRLFMYRNGLFIGVPFITAGMLISKYEKKLTSVNPYLLISLLVVFCFVLFAESYDLYYRLQSVDYMVSLIIFTPLLFISILKYSKKKYDSGYIGLLSSSVFYVHILIISLVLSILPHEDYKICIYPLVLCLSFVLSVAVIELNKRVKIFL